MINKKLYISLLLLLISFKGTAQHVVPVDAESEVKFSIKNLGLEVEGSFSGLSGSVFFDKGDIAKSSVSVSVVSSSIKTGIGLRDRHLKKEEYLAVEKFPVISFVSKTISVQGKGTYLMVGYLTLKGVTKEVTFPFSIREISNGIIMNGSFSINRRYFNVGGNSLTMGDEVILKLNVKAETVNGFSRNK
jgi:polyisoprenoid-binding protein YceI